MPYTAEEILKEMNDAMERFGVTREMLAEAWLEGIREARKEAEEKTESVKRKRAR